MTTTISLRAVSPAKRLTFTAVFAALVCVSTFAIAIPLPLGYFNLGDAFVLLSAWCLGPIYGAIAAATGSAFADIFAGYAIYVPATFVIKGLNAFVAYTVYAFFKKLISKDSIDFLPRILSAVGGELITVLGYFAFESCLYGVAGASLALAGNGLQGVCSLIVAVALVSVLYPLKPTRKLFFHK